MFNRASIKRFIHLGILPAVVLASAFTFVQPTGTKQSSEDTFVYRKITNTAFTFNEKLSYRVHYGVINAATVDLDKPSEEDFTEVLSLIEDMKKKTNSALAQRIIDNWAEAKRWSPSMDKTEVERLYRNWKKAVTRTFDWVDEDVIE